MADSYVDPAATLEQARMSLHNAVASHGDRRRMFAHDAASLAASVALEPTAQSSQIATAQDYIAQAQGHLERAHEEMRDSGA